MGVKGNGIPIFHAFGRLFGIRLRFLWAALRMICQILKYLPFPKRRYALEVLATKVREGWRFSDRLHAVRQLRYEELRSGGHHFHMTVPDEVARVISQWVASP